MERVGTTQQLQWRCSERIAAGEHTINSDDDLNGEAEWIAAVDRSIRRGNGLNGEDELIAAVVRIIHSGDVPNGGMSGSQAEEENPLPWRCSERIAASEHIINSGDGFGRG